MIQSRLPALLTALSLLVLVAIGLASTQPAQGATSFKKYLPLVLNDLPTSTPTFTPTSTPTNTPTSTPSPSPTPIENAYSHGTPGYDLSWPQCGASQPIPSTASNGAAYTFAIVGVTGGKAYTNNNCLNTEYGAATSQGVAVSYYMNIDDPIGLPNCSSCSNGNTGPRGTCAPTDTNCLSYNFGYNAAQAAYNWATSQIGTNSLVGHVWWLDVETANSWTSSTSSNDQAIQGAIDYLQQSGSTVGVYSITSMWDDGRTVGSAADGSQALATSLPLWPYIAGSGYLPPVPSWTSGAYSLPSAASMCSSGSFTGGATWLVQEPNYYAPDGANYDEDYAC